MSDDNKRKVIVDAFVREVSATSLGKVRISALIKELNINRNTFYYYFTSKYDTALWIFEHDLARELKATCKPYELVYLPQDSDNPIAEPLPYYAHAETGAHTLDITCFVKALVHSLQGNVAFYEKLFDERELEFAHTFIDRYRPAIEDDLRFILGGRYLPESTFNLLTGEGVHYLLYCARSVFSIYASKTEDILDERINPFWNIYMDAVSEAIQRHPVNRLAPDRRKR